MSFSPDALEDGDEVHSTTWKSGKSSSQYFLQTVRQGKGSWIVLALIWASGFDVICSVDDPTEILPEYCITDRGVDGHTENVSENNFTFLKQSLIGHEPALLQT